MENIYYSKKGRKPKMEGIWVHNASGKKIKVKVRKNLPAKCKTPKRICILCQKTVIPKQSLRYESKKCESCVPKI